MRNHFDPGLEHRGSQRSVHQFIFETRLEIIDAEETLLGL